ncbi:MAG: glycosyltransferase family 4 protein [Bacteroidota bacterium]
MGPIIHIILGRANPNRLNGVNRVVHNLAEEQHSLGWNVSVWGITASYKKVDEVERNYHTCWFPDKGYLRISLALKAALLVSPKDTIFHFHGGFVLHYVSISRYLKKIKRNYVLTPHGAFSLGAMEKNKWLKAVYFSLLAKRLVRDAKAVQCLGHNEKSDLESLGDFQHIHLIPNGQNFDLLSTPDPDPTKAEFVIGYCGRIEQRAKGLDILLDSFRYYRQELGGKGCLHLVGEGTYMEEMMQTSREMGIDNYLHFWGKRFGEEKVQILAQMKLFVHSSRYEGLPTAVIEALSMGIPCLVSKATSMDTYVKLANAGWTYENNDITQIATYLKDAEKEHEKGILIERGIRAIKMARIEFSWREVALKTQNLYT